MKPTTPTTPPPPSTKTTTTTPFREMFRECFLSVPRSRSIRTHVADHVRRQRAVNGASLRFYFWRSLFFFSKFHIINFLLFFFFATLSLSRNRRRTTGPALADRIIVRRPPHRLTEGSDKNHNRSVGRSAVDYVIAEPGRQRWRLRGPRHRWWPLPFQKLPRKKAFHARLIDSEYIYIFF